MAIANLSQRRFADVIIAMVVVVVGGIIGANYIQAFRAAGGKEDFGQREFAAAVAQACGHGFVDIGYSLTPELDDFLALKRDTFDCASLPAEVPHALPNLTQGLYRYLMSTVAMVWKVRGVKWSVLSPLFGLAYGLTLAAAYLLFRWGMGRVTATTLTAVLSISAVHLGYLPYLRDYAKAPFILALLLIMVRIAAVPLERRRALVSSAVFGVVLGIGFGFRNDLLINIVPWIGVVLFCTPGGLLRQLPLKAACLVVSIGLFWLVALPVFTAYGRGSNSGHVALLGLMDAFDGTLGVSGAAYKWGYGYSDSLVSTQINSYSFRLYDRPVPYLSAEYDKAMVEYILRIVRDWPADIAVRAYGSVLKVLEFPFEVGKYHNRVPFGLQSEWVQTLYAWQIGTLELLTGLGPYVVAAALVIIAGTSIRVALSLGVLLLYFTGYPAIQFNSRHFFHLEFITWWALGFVITQAARWRPGRNTGISPVSPWSTPWARAAAFAGVVAVVLVGSVAGLRAYQAPHVRSLLNARYLGAPRATLAMVPVPAGSGRTLVSVPDVWRGRPAAWSVDAAYVIAEFSAAACRTNRVTATFRYKAQAPPTDFSYDTTVTIVPGPEPTRVFFPGYFSLGWTEFTGVELDNVDVPCLTSVAKMDDAQRPELLLNLTLTPNWATGKLYQTLQAFETANEGDGRSPTHYSYPYGQRISSLGGAQPIALPGDPAPVVASIVAPAGNGWTIEGRPASAYAYLVQYQPRPLPAGTTLTLAGDVRRGRFSIGLLRDAQWAGVVNVVTTGPFVATIAVPTDGAYALVIADYSLPPWIDRHWPWLRARLPARLAGVTRVSATIDQAGWVLPAEARDSHD